MRMIVYMGMHVSTKESCMCMQAEGQHLFNPLKPIRANKTARGLLSPFQVKDFQFAYAIA